MARGRHSSRWVEICNPPCEAFSPPPLPCSVPLRHSALWSAIGILPGAALFFYLGAAAKGIGDVVAKGEGAGGLTVRLDEALMVKQCENGDPASRAALYRYLRIMWRRG